MTVSLAGTSWCSWYSLFRRSKSGDGLMVGTRQCFERRMLASSFLANRTMWRSGVRVCGMLLVVCLLFVLKLQGFFGQKNTSTGPSPPVAYLRDSLSLFSACQWNEVARQPKRRRTGDAFCEGKSLERVTKADVGGGGPWAPDDGASSAKNKTFRAAVAGATGCGQKFAKKPKEFE